jgi:hypothetical protein
VAFSPSVVINLSSYNSFYFMDVIFWISIIVVLAFSSLFYRRVFSRESFASGWGILWSCLFIASIAYFSHAYYNSSKRYANASVNYGNFRIRKLVYGDTATVSFMKELKSYFRSDAKKEFLQHYYRTTIQTDADRDEYYKLLKQLKRLDSVAVEIKAKSLLYINYSRLPQLHDLYCYQVPLVFPALTGMAMIEGAPQAGCIKEGYGFDYYENRSFQDYSRDWTVVELCEKAKLQGFKLLCYYDIRERSIKWYNADTGQEAIPV